MVRGNDIFGFEHFAFELIKGDIPEGSENMKIKLQ